MGYSKNNGAWLYEDEVPISVPKSARTKRVINALSTDGRQELEDSIFIKQLLLETYSQHYTEIEMLILSISGLTHREISKVLNISRLGVTKRIAKAREILRAKMEEMLREG
ncbi:MAG TPA: hypothetical protein ENG48_11130 [Candidatus Atribacteria bacterium]|nr:hypothetical protein [Candidatus Atribacteria bacterium]